MKKLISIFVALIMLLGIFSISAFAENTPVTANVYVTIANAGTLVLTQEKITVTDKDNDGKLNIDEALIATHEAKFEGGAAAGYGSDVGQYGLYVTKLWGVENGGGYGYYVNNASAMGLSDEVKEGDYINAFTFTDLTTWSDKYTFFDKNTLTATAEEEITLTLSAAGYDASYNPITVPVKNATITLNGEATEYKTDENGKVTMKISKSGTYVISATSATETLVPPLLTVTVNAKVPAESTPETSEPETSRPEASEPETSTRETIKPETTVPEIDTVENTETSETTSPKTGDSSDIALYTVFSLMSAMVVVFSTIKFKKNTNEK